MSDRVQIWLRRFLFGGTIFGAFVVTAIVLAEARPLVWKLADQTFCLADWEGFREVALPGLHPGGALKWLSALMMTTGIMDDWWWGAYAVLTLAVAWRAPMATLLLTMSSFLHLGTHVWQLPDFAFPMTNLLGMVVVMALFLGLRPLVRRWWWCVLPAVGVCALAFIPLGLYALFAAALLVLDSLFAERGRRVMSRRLPSALVAMGLLAVTPGLVSLFVYEDLAVDLTIGHSQSVLNGALLEPFGFWPVGSFLLLGWSLLGGCAWGRLGISALLFVLAFIGQPKDDVRSQLRVERLMNEGLYAEALAMEEQDPHPLRMSIAYRILALWRTNRLESDLFRRPFTSYHRHTTVEELKMDGQRLLFEYGFLLPARQVTMESVAAKGWQPGHLRLLGDVAFLTGEHALAMRNWRQLARCPFRKEFAQRRLQALVGGKGLADPAFADLRAVAMLHAVWCREVATREEPPFYHFADSNVESFVYGRLLKITGLPPVEVARLVLAVYLVEKDVRALSASRGVMDMICPQGLWPRLWQQGMLAHLARCSEQERVQTVETLRDGVFSQEEVDRFDQFVADLQKAAQTPVDFSARYGDTYYFYENFVE